MVLRPEAIRAKLKKLRKMVGLLDKIRALGEAAYNEDELTQAAAERALQIACLCVLDIGNHLIAEKALPLPNDNDEIITTLQKAGIISQDLAGRLEGLGGFRNVLVHDYLDLDHGRIFNEHLQRLGDLRDFATEVMKLVGDVEKKKKS
jgi:uncharacterized protein YutE (UPF0331/DUF86 family)